MHPWTYESEGRRRKRVMKFEEKKVSINTKEMGVLEVLYAQRTRECKKGETTKRLIVLSSIGLVISQGNRTSE